MILRLVSLRTNERWTLVSSGIAHAPVEVRRLDVTKALRFARTEQHNVCRDKVVALQTDDVPDDDILSLLVRKCSVRLEDLC